ncbi:MAG: type II toxin-antitoxin system VapC family toxin [Planctomycetes bacterium]|nr:type II toxin-antitoxin system VapC family toxin [Planctomycetota bacterium]
MNEVFLDTSFAIALSVRSDQYHRRAVEVSTQLQQNGTLLVMTRAIVLEIGNALSKQAYRQAAVSILSSLEADPNVDIVSLSETLYLQALELFSKRPDKEWSLTDCISFVIMDQRGLKDALTADLHFQQAGFQPLLREQAN